ncbi:MAG TPA: hypothetical protein DCF48_04310 [Rikenellaceae bacterium]|nr:hypothetical protein [Rikenellaceae bacterium]
MFGAAKIIKIFEKQTAPATVLGRAGGKAGVGQGRGLGWAGPGWAGPGRGWAGLGWAGGGAGAWLGGAGAGLGRGEPFRARQRVTARGG